MRSKDAYGRVSLFNSFLFYWFHQFSCVKQSTAGLLYSLCTYFTAQLEEWTFFFAFQYVRFYKNVANTSLGCQLGRSPRSGGRNNSPRCQTGWQKGRPKVNYLYGRHANPSLFSAWSRRSCHKYLLCKSVSLLKSPLYIKRWTLHISFNLLSKNRQIMRRRG